MIYTAEIKDVKVNIETSDLNASFEVLDLQGMIHILPLKITPDDWQGLIINDEYGENPHLKSIYP